MDDITVEQAIESMKLALRDSKGWTLGYAEAIIRDAIDRKAEASATGAEPDWKAEYYGAQEVLTKIRTALNASGRWALGESIFEAIDKLLATPTTSTTGNVDASRVRDEALEEAAKMCERRADSIIAGALARQCARDIRSRIGTPKSAEGEGAHLPHEEGTT